MEFQTKPLTGRYFCFCIVVRVNQIEVAPGVNIGHDERRENTVENLIAYREAIRAADPDARITIAFSHEALTDPSENFAALRKKAKEYHLLYGDDITYMLGAYFSGAYSRRREINAHVDAALELLRGFMGKDYLPGAIVGGFVPAGVMEHIADLGIHTVQGIIFSQYSIDCQDGDGSPCYPYFPSKEHFCKPAQSEEDFIDVVVFDGWTVDFINATVPGIANGCNSRMGCGPLETYLPFGRETGEEIILKTAGQMFEESYALNGNFGFAAAIWELCLIQKNGIHGLEIDGGDITDLFREMKRRFPGVKLVSYGELGEAFRKAHKNNDDLCYVFKHKGIGIGGSDRNTQIEWFMNARFRMALRTDLSTGERRVIDFTDYTKPASEPPDSNYREGIVNRNWSLLGDLNQKGLRPQDTPVSPEELTARQKDLISAAEKQFGIRIL